MTEIPKALIQLKAETNNQNWAKIRRHLARFLDCLRNLAILPNGLKEQCSQLIAREYLNIVDRMVLSESEDQKMSKKDMISFTKNCIVTFRYTGYSKDYATYVTDDGTPQKKMNKKYPNL